MGNSFACFSQNQQKSAAKTRPPAPAPVPLPPSLSISGSRKSQKVVPSSSSSMKERFDEAYIKEQAMTAVLLLRQHHQQQNGGVSQFDRSVSLRDALSSSSSRRQKKIPRSSSSRPTSSLFDSLPQSLHPLQQDPNTEDTEETRHFVLVHGGGFGAWCWYKTTTFLKESGYQVDAIDLTASGAHPHDSDSITTLAQYIKPLTYFLENLPRDRKVILVGHDIGGACISYAMELHKSKISKAIFVAAAMLKNEQSILDMFSQKPGMDDLFQRAQIFMYANGKKHPPTAINFDRSLVKDTFFNQTPAKDVELASVSMRPVPFAPLTEKLSLSATNYGSIPRFYIKTQEDFAIPLPLQEAMIHSNPPQQVFLLKGSDHSPFLSRPQALHKVLVEISHILPK
ncbi:putative methylesterase 11, chloroplastic [Ipomoea triloba]|uniref:putative methylesterase 11, chloroplastic n=1 Tax=Ipomoea triloba TaxID=35885 RepID=UPI00125E8102|nr:putative methylesterase 11, chloroplastic [Ipomoea triloba]